jgi:uncharacterized surface protein with fasciclin (FAS1) repeats
MARIRPASAAIACALPAPAQVQDSVDVATAAGSFAILVEAVGAAGLVGTPEGGGPFSVVAPNGCALAAIEAGGAFEQLLMRTGTLGAFHVVPGRVKAADLTEGMMPTTVQGQALVVTLAGRPKVNGFDIVAPGTPVSNGVIHAMGKSPKRPE